MKLHALEIEGFGSFLEAQRLDFTGRAPGLYMVAGRNDVDPALGSNGAGKSTLWSALSWCLYGKTPRGLRATSIRSWLAKKGQPTQVVVDCTLNQKEYTITRRWRPNKLLCSTNKAKAEPVTQDQLDAILGLDYAAFTSSVVTGQFGPFFLDLGPTQRAAAFSSLLQFETWSGFAAQARKQARDLGEPLVQLENTLFAVDGEITGLEAADYEKQADEWDEENAKQIRDTKSRVAETKRSRNKAVKHLAAAQRDDKMATQELAVLDRKFKEAQSRLEAARDDYRDANADRSRITGARREVLAQLDEAKGIKATCPVCHQRVARDHLREVTETLLRKSAKLKRELDAADRATKAALDKANKRDVLVEDLRLQQDQVSRKRGELRFKIVNAERDMTSADTELGRHTKDLRKLQDAINPYRDKHRQHRQKLMVLRDKRRKARAEKTRLLTLQDQVEYWAQTGFKTIQTQLVGTALTAFETEMAAAMETLGLEQWSVQASMTQERDTSPDKLGFFLDISSPTSPAESAAGWESWSGGEGQRLRLAGQIALAALICDSRGLSPNVLILDEPCSYLSAQGIDDILALLANRARAEGTQVWVTEHRSLTSGHLAGGVTVVKTPNGSIIEEGVQ